MAKRKTLMDEIRQELAGDRELNAAYQRELARLDLAHQVLSLRRHCHLSQSQLAERIGTKQAGVARMERAGYTGYTMATLAKVAAATGATLQVRLALPRRLKTAAAPVSRGARP